MELVIVFGDVDVRRHIRSLQRMSRNVIAVARQKDVRQRRAEGGSGGEEHRNILKGQQRAISEGMYILSGILQAGTGRMP